MVKKVSCRKAFTSALENLAARDENIFMICTDSRGSVTAGGFADKFPERFIEAGIAEQNAVGIAAGLAETGKNVFVAGPACFLAARSFEQVKVDVAYNNLSVKVIGVSAGVSYGPLGGTHTALHDIAGFRALPNIEVYVPGDSHVTAFITGHLAKSGNPAYMRTGRGDVPEIYNENDRFDIHKAKMVRDGKDATIIACGEMVYPSKLAAELLEKEGISVRVLDLFCLKPFDKEAIIQAARETRVIVTVEEHSIFGGLGELVCAVTAQNHPTRVKVMGFPDEEYKIGGSAELFEHYGFTPGGIAFEVKKLVNAI